MKTPKSSDNEEVTPSKKVLKQARLPFKLISDDSPKSITPPSRKRKLSLPKPEPVSKIGKITKENDLSEETVIITDDDSNDTASESKVVKTLNPLVKLVDIARKKKLQKAKNSKKKKNALKEINRVPNGIKTDENESHACDVQDKGAENVEVMDVDETESKETVSKTTVKSEKKKSAENMDNTVEDTEISVNTEILSGENKNSELSLSENKESSDTKIDKDVSVNKSIKENKSKLSVTPKRSDRNKPKIEDNNLDISQVSNCDDSLSSNPSTPRRSTRNISLTNSQGDTSLNETANTSITPKQLQKKLESAKKKEEREKEKIEREIKRQQEKEDRVKQKQEKDELRKREREEKEEVKKKEREEKEEQRKKEKEEKDKQKELEKKQREEKEEQKKKEKEEKEEQKKKEKEEKEEQKKKEKEEKEEQKKKEKEAKEEEKRKKQEVLEQEKQEQEQKKKKAAEAFASFFVAKQKSEKDQVTMKDISKNNMLSSFTIKSDMRLAPIIRVDLDEECKKKLENLLVEQNVPEISLYIKSLKGRKPLSYAKTWPPCDKNDDDVMIIDDDLPPADGVGEIISCDAVIGEKLRPKLLAFHENRRPPYWGTWRKKSMCINPRTPFKTDPKLLDYEVDSDDDWEEEQEGESLDGSAAGSDDEQDGNEYEVDNELFVPHGYLSDEEATMDEDDVFSLSPEAQKAKLKHLEDEFESEMKKPMEKLKPRLYGLLWEKSEGGKPDHCAEALWNYIAKFSMVIDPVPVLQPAPESEEPEKKKVKKKKNTENEKQSPKSDKKKKAKVEENDGKNNKIEAKKSVVDSKKNQPGINHFLTKLKTT